MHYMINWYRAGFRYPLEPKANRKVRPPTKIIWGKNDAFSEYRLAQMSVQHCQQAQVVILPDAGHWLLHEEPAVITQLMSTFFKAESR
jgi:pimeloyl-ACP methyl ester carboxylesterase